MLCSLRFANRLPRKHSVLLCSKPLCRSTDLSCGGLRKRASVLNDRKVASVQDQPIVIRPPLAVRAGLVGASTALMTPLFPIIGFNHLVFRFLPPDQRMVVHGGTSMMYFSAMVLMPNAFYYAPVLLPFAIGNGVTAGSVYVLAESCLGGPEAMAAHKIFRIVPLAGPLVGLSTALLVPLTYPLSWTLCYPTNVAVTGEIYNMIFSWCYSFGPAMTCLASTGLASGLLLDTFVRPVVLGVTGWPWQQLAGVVLAATALCLTALYSTSFRTQVLHVNDVDLDAASKRDGGLLDFIFPSRVPCYVKGVEELCWVPTMDPTSGEVYSEQWKVFVDGDGFFKVDQENKECPKIVAGLQAFERAAVLRKRVQHERLRVYMSQHSALFDGLFDPPLTRSSIGRLSEELPIGEAMMTDALVMLLSGSPSSVLERSLEQLLPSMRESSLVRRLGSSLNPLKRNWTSGLCHDGSESLRSWLGELTLRAAQMRELLRLEAGAASTGNWTADELQQQLAAAGVDHRRARAALKKLNWNPLDTASRSADLKVICDNHTRMRYESVGSAALLISVLAGVLFSMWGNNTGN